MFLSQWKIVWQKKKKTNNKYMYHLRLLVSIYMYMYNITQECLEWGQINMVTDWLTKYTVLGFCLLVKAKQLNTDLIITM